MGFFKVKTHLCSWSSDHEKLSSRSVILPENFSCSTTDSKQFSKQPKNCAVTWKILLFLQSFSFAYSWNVSSPEKKRVPAGTDDTMFIYKEGLQFIYSSSESPSLEYPPLFPPETELRLLLLLLLMLWLPQLLLLGMVGLERCWAEVRADEAEPVAPTLEFLVLKGATELCLKINKQQKRLLVWIKNFVKTNKKLPLPTLFLYKM